MRMGELRELRELREWELRGFSLEPYLIEA